MVTLKRFYWAVGLLSLGFILFFWGSTPQEAMDYKPLVTARPDVTAEDATSAALAFDASVVAPSSAEINFGGTRVWFDPPQPLPGDTLRLVFANAISSADRAQILWSHNQIPVTTATGHRSLVLEPNLYRKGHYVAAVVRGAGWQEEIGVRIRNRAPVMEGIGKPVQDGYDFVVDIRGSDPEGDPIWLELPVNSPGIRVLGLQVRIDPLSMTESRSIPMALTDGDNQTTFLLPLNQGQFSGYIPPPEPESDRARAKREERQNRERSAGGNEDHPPEDD